MLIILEIPIDCAKMFSSSGYDVNNIFSKCLYCNRLFELLCSFPSRSLRLTFYLFFFFFLKINQGKGDKEIHFIFYSFFFFFYFSKKLLKKGALWNVSCYTGTYINHFGRFHYTAYKIWLNYLLCHVSKLLPGRGGEVFHPRWIG